MQSDGDFLMRHSGAETRCYLGLCRQILADREPNVLQRFFTRLALAVAAWQIITPNREPFLGFHQRHLIVHDSKVQPSENFLKLFFRSNAGPATP